MHEWELTVRLFFGEISWIISYFKFFPTLEQFSFYLGSKTILRNIHRVSLILLWINNVFTFYELISIVYQVHFLRTSGNIADIWTIVVIWCWISSRNGEDYFQSLSCTFILHFLSQLSSHHRTHPQWQLKNFVFLLVQSNWWFDLPIDPHFQQNPRLCSWVYLVLNFCH
jgi:hypothetical protein